mmetsp:Transcript_1210/g.2653  ORF Transcript_1210/g.2653 Transcript_1210/m.2653 type:complete len:223 (+) Transcript_1210:373-1041(+)
MSERKHFLPSTSCCIYCDKNPKGFPPCRRVVWVKTVLLVHRWQALEPRWPLFQYLSVRWYRRLQLLHRSQLNLLLHLLQPPLPPLLPAEATSVLGCHHLPPKSLSQPPQRFRRHPCLHRLFSKPRRQQFLTTMVGETRMMMMAGGTKMTMAKPESLRLQLQRQPSPWPPKWQMKTTFSGQRSTMERPLNQLLWRHESQPALQSSKFQVARLARLRRNPLFKS